jgi:hypothetical protein
MEKNAGEEVSQLEIYVAGRGRVHSMGLISVFLV